MTSRSQEPIGDASEGQRDAKTQDKYRRAAGVIRNIHDTYFLVNIVDNGYTKAGSDIFQIFRSIIHSSLSRTELMAKVSTLHVANRMLRKKLSNMEKVHDGMNAQLADALSESARLRLELEKVKAHIQQQRILRS